MSGILLPVADGDVSTHVADNQIEVEWQFDALDLRPVERWVESLTRRFSESPSLGTLTAVAQPVRRLADQYLDTDDRRIGRAGFVLRTRRRGRRLEATLKDSRAPAAGGLRRRLEVTEPLPAEGINGLGSSGPVGWRVGALVGKRSLSEVLEVRTRRRAFALRVSGTDVAELALDETVMSAGAGQRPARLCRVEVEVDPQWVEPLEPMVNDLRDTCGLRPAALSKFEAGLLALGMTVPGPPDLGSVTVEREPAFGDVALAVVRRHLGTMLAKEPGTRLGEDPEELHQMRVSTRRLRAALDFFTEALPARSRSLSDELAWIAAVLGRVRDLDVQIERTTEMREWVGEWVQAWDGDAASDGSPLDRLLDVLAAARDRERAALLDALDSTRWERLVTGLTSLTRPVARPLALARVPATSVLPDLVRARHRAAARAARRARRSRDPADFHRLRIRCKRLRYSLEFASLVYGERADRFARRLARLQDALGLVQDGEVATARLWALATHPTGASDTDPGSRDAPSGLSQRASALPPATVFCMGAVADRYRTESAEHVAAMPRRLKLLHGSQWRALDAVMQRRQAPVAPSTPRVPDLPAHLAPPAPAPPAPAPPAPAPVEVDPIDALSQWPVAAWGLGPPSPHSLATGGDVPTDGTDAAQP